MTERRRTTEPGRIAVDPWDYTQPDRPEQTYDRSGQRGGRVTETSCKPIETVAGSTASDLAAWTAGVTGSVDISGNWENADSFTLTIDVGAGLEITSGGTVYGTGTPGTYPGVQVCATNVCGESCTDPFTMVISPP